MNHRRTARVPKGVVRLGGLLLLTSLAAAQADEVTLPPQRAADLVRRVARRAHRTVHLDPELADRIVVVRIDRMRNLVVGDVAEALGAEVVVDGDGAERLVPQWKAALFRALERKPAAQPTAPAQLGVAWLRAATGINVVADPSRKEPTAEIDPAGLTAREIVDRLAKANGLAWDLRWGTVFLAPPARLAAWPPATLDGLPAKAAALPFRRTPVANAVAYLRAVYGVAFRVDAGVDARVTANLAGVTLPQALAAITLPYGLEAVPEDDAIVIRKTRAVTFDVRDRTLDEALRGLGVPVDVDPRYRARKVTVSAEGLALPQAVEKIARVVGARSYRKPDGGWSILPGWKRTLRRKLSRDVEFSAKGRLSKVLQDLSLRTGATIVLDPDERGGPEVALETTNAGARLLDQLTAPDVLAWDLRYGVVLVATPARLAELPRANPFRDRGLPTREIDLPFRNAPLPAALQYLQVASGVTVEPAAGQADTVDGYDVSLTASWVEFPDALALTLLPLGFTADVKEGKVLVRVRKP